MVKRWELLDGLECGISPACLLFMCLSVACLSINCCLFVVRCLFVTWLPSVCCLLCVAYSTIEPKNRVMVRFQACVSTINNRNATRLTGSPRDPPELQICMIFVPSSLFFPQTDLSVGVLAVLVRGPVIVSGRRAADCLQRFVVNINTKSLFLQKLNAF
jgi:hypothetical protein